MRPSAERVRELFFYDEFEGKLYWKKAESPRIKVGSLAGGLNNKGYRKIQVDGKSYAAHQLVWVYVTGEWPEFQLDHKNHDKDCNRIDNLRPATNIENCQNQDISVRNSAGYKGVYPKGGKFGACIGFNYKSIHLGTYDTPVDAARAYNAAAIRLYGDFAKLNRIEEVL